MAEQTRKSSQAATPPPAGTRTDNKSQPTEMQRSSSLGNGGVKDQAHGLVEQMRSSATDVLRTAKSNTAAKIEEQKSTLSSGLSNVAENVRKLGDDMAAKKDADPLTRFAADYSETAAEKLESVATYFDSHDLNAIYHDVEDLARRNPTIFIGGALALGFLAARFFKSTSPRYMEGGGAMQSKTTRSLNQPRAQASM